MVMSAKQFTQYLKNKSNEKLLETLKNRSYYSKTDVNAVKKEILKRKKLGKMRSDAGRKR